MEEHTGTNQHETKYSQFHLIETPIIKTTT